jgi:hypothetical protein
MFKMRVLQNSNQRCSHPYLYPWIPMQYTTTFNDEVETFRPMLRIETTTLLHNHHGQTMFQIGLSLMKL